MSCHNQNNELQGRSNYSMYIREFRGERFFGDYPNRKLAARDAEKIFAVGAIFSIVLEDEENNCWDYTTLETGSRGWVDVYYDDDQENIPETE